ncbi:unnamed protein product, partial [Polarella glacialis]
VTGVQSFEFAPLNPKVGFQARLAVFVPDTRDDMQRVIGQAEVTIVELTANASGLQATPSAKASVASGQVADLLWNHSGTCLLGHCQTEVDESGQSYYGGSRLIFLSQGGEVKKDLTDEAGSNGTSVQAVAWHPNRDEFVLIQGFQPAAANLWVWDEASKKVSNRTCLLEKAHRNTIRFNPYGSLLMLGGFGNLAGGVDFFGRLEDEYVHVSSATANCTVTAEWAPDGRHFLTAVLAPRMRVDNGVHVWQALTGIKVAEHDFEELYDTQWRPEPVGGFRDVLPEEIAAATQADVIGAAEFASNKKSAYRPPKARGETANMVAAMMRGEVAAPDDDRRRKPRQQKARGDEEQGAEGE